MDSMRLVIKVGTSLIAPGGRIDTRQLRSLVDQLQLSRDEILIVSSGAIASGMANLGLKERPATVPLMQACAAVGQSALMHTYEQLFFGKKAVAQLLLSSDDFTSELRYTNLPNTLHPTWKASICPTENVRAWCAPFASSRRKWKHSRMDTESWGAAACARSCARRKRPVKRA